MGFKKQLLQKIYGIEQVNHPWDGISEEDIRRNVVLPWFSNSSTKSIDSQLELSGSKTIQQSLYALERGSHLVAQRLLGLYNGLFKVNEEPKRIRVCIVGVHGWFPMKIFNRVIGEPIGTSSYFGAKMHQAVATYLKGEGYLPQNTHLDIIPLDGEGKILERVEVLLELLLLQKDVVMNADLIIFSAHSQGSPVSAILIQKLIQMSIIDPKKQNTGILAMAGISHGPFPHLKSSVIIKYVETDHAKELFDFNDPTSAVSIKYKGAMMEILESGVRYVAVGSWYDQVVPLYSATVQGINHPNIYRALFIHAQDYIPDFLSHLVVFALKLRNKGISDFGLVVILSDLLAGSIYGFGTQGHSALYEEDDTYNLGINFIMDPKRRSTKNSSFEGLIAPTKINPYYLPWIMARLVESRDIDRNKELKSDLETVRELFLGWTPGTKDLRDLKYRLEPLKSKISKDFNSKEFALDVRLFKKMEVISFTLWILFGVIFPFQLLKFILHRPLSWESGVSNDNEGRTRRSFLLTPKDTLISTPHASVTTLYDILVYAARIYPATKKCFGSRMVRNEIKESKMIKKMVGGKEVEEEKVWTFFDLGGYTWVTYRDVLATAQEWGAGLVSLGLKKQDKVTIFHSTGADWMTMSYACYSQNICITTAYDSLGVEALAYSLNESEVSVLFTQADLISVVSQLGSKVPTLKAVVYSGNLASKPSGALKYVSLQELRELGQENPIEVSKPSEDDLACIMYTSGSTGNPKGVMITHANMVAATGGALAVLDSCKGVVDGVDDKYLAYLPLAHVLEFLVENFCVYKGVAIGYGSPRTLTDGSVRNCLGDIRELKPTLMAGVPAVWETIRKGIVGKVSKASKAQQLIFKVAFNLKRFLVKYGVPTSFIDQTIFKKVRDGTGGRLRAAISGGAPVSQETQEFLNLTLCPLLQGYGMTECCGMMTIQTLEECYEYGNVGSVSPAAEIKLVASNNYDPNGEKPKGEIWVRGGIVMKGYYKQPLITQENLTKDGWLMTGDIGEFLPDGSLRIIDRKKNLVKLSNGEYVALEKLESQYKSSKYVMNMCVFADSLENHIVALVLIDQKELKALQDQYHLNDEQVNHPSIIREVAKDFADLAKSGGLKGADLLKVFTLIGSEWTAQNGLLTAAQKIKRKEIVEMHSDDIKRMYNK